jgi:hypothetical protein
MAVNARKSKKQSVASSRLPPEPLIFFTDENLGRQIVPGALRAAGVEVKVYTELFSPGLHDREWLRIACPKRWVILTTDSRISCRRNEMQLLLAAGARTFVLVSSNLPGAEIGVIFVKALPRIKKLCARQPAPFIAHIHSDGKVLLMAASR